VPPIEEDDGPTRSRRYGEIRPRKVMFHIAYLTISLSVRRRLTPTLSPRPIEWVELVSEISFFYLAKSIKI
jgi:hypothetical protein